MIDARILDFVDALKKLRRARQRDLLLSEANSHPREGDQLDRLLALSHLEVSELFERAAATVATDSQSNESDQFAIYVYWCDSAPMLPERSYRAVSRGIECTAKITDLSYRIEPGDKTRIAGKILEQGQIAYCKLSADRAIAFAGSSGDNVLIFTDDQGAAVLGIALLHFALRRATNIVWHPTRVTKEARSSLNRQRPCVVWLTGLSGSGKSTIADLLEQELHAAGCLTYLLDGDNVRHGLCRDLGFTDVDRVENIRRVAEVAKLMIDAGLIVITSFISPFESERRMARDLIGEADFVEVYVDAPLAVCEARDPKGLYKKARAGHLKNFTGIDSDYEAPQHAELTLSTVECAPEVLANEVVDYLQNHLFIN